MKNKMVIGIDPGDRYVGLASWCHGAPSLRTIDRSELSGPETLNEILGYINACRTLYGEDKEVVVVMEKFLNYNHKVQIKGYKENETSQLIGSIQALCQYSGYELIMQTASQAKSWNDERLTRLGVLRKLGNGLVVANNYVDTKTSRHSRDAFRHIIYYLNKTLFDGCITREDILWNTDN